MRNSTKHTLCLSHIHTRAKWSPAVVSNKVASLVWVGWQRWIGRWFEVWGEGQRKWKCRRRRTRRLDYTRIWIEREKKGNCEKNWRKRKERGFPSLSHRKVCFVYQNGILKKGFISQRPHELFTTFWVKQKCSCFAGTAVVCLHGVAATDTTFRYIEVNNFDWCTPTIKIRGESAST